MTASGKHHDAISLFGKGVREGISYVLATIIVGLFLWSGAVSAETWAEREDVAARVDEMVQRYNLDRGEVIAIIARGEFRPDILAAITRPAEAKQWSEYRPLFITPERIEAGALFWEKHAETLAQAEQFFGVPAPIILGILGVETGYGQHQGTYRVIDALATLGFDYPPRGEFFRGELAQYLLLAHEERLDPLAVLGSYAGAMGLPQFMPSSYRRYAVDFDEDGKRDLWNSPADAIGSIAYYLMAQGWQAGQPVALRAEATGEDYKVLTGKGVELRYGAGELKAKGIELPAQYPEQAQSAVIELQTTAGPELWLGLTNFYTITRYNRSALYAMAVYQLGEEIRVRHLARAAPKHEKICIIEPCT